MVRIPPRVAQVPLTFSCGTENQIGLGARFPRLGPGRRHVGTVGEQIM